MPRGPANSVTSMVMDSYCGASVVYEAGKRRTRANGSMKLQVRTVAYRFVCCNLRPTRSTTGPAKSSAGGPRQRSSRTSYAHYNSPVLQRPVDLANYTSAEFGKALRVLDIRQSVGRTGTCYDNAMAESFFSVLKNERVHRTEYPTRQHATSDIARYIELRYNSKRLHSGLGYKTPHEVHNEYLNRQLAA
jgi:putative transposase